MQRKGLPALPLSWVAAVTFALGLTSSAQAQPAAEDTLTLRLRDAPLRDVAHALFELTRQGYVVDSDVVGRADVELVAQTPAEVERALKAVGLALSGPGRMRRVAPVGRDATLRLSGKGFPMPFVPSRPGSVRDFLRLMAEVTEDEILAPAGPLGLMLAFADEVPAEDLMSAVLASARLDHAREGTLVRVSHPADPDAVLFPVSTPDEHYGHVPYREGDARMAASAGIWGVPGREVTVSGVIGRGTAWSARLLTGFYPAGTRLHDGILESVGPDGTVILLDSGERIEWRIGPAAGGISMLPESVSQVIERARVARDAREFDEAERILRAALAAARTSGEQSEVRADLGDLHYAWAQTLLDRHAVPDAVRHFEAAYEVDRAERPWQAGEDLNEIGFAWAAIGEMERAAGPHGQALELARTADLRKEPRGPSCVRMHPRSSWIEPSALTGLANADRARGRYVEARDRYFRAIALWREVGDPVGESSALTGLGLVHSGLGEKAPALELQERASKTPRLPASARAAILNNLGGAQLALGRRDLARASFDAALVDYQFTRDRAGEGVVLNNLGALLESSDALADACTSYVRALQASRQGDDRRGEAATRARLQRLVARLPDDPRLSGCRETLAR